MSGSPPGLDLAALSKHLDAVAPGLLGADLRADVIAGGKSNLTYDVTDGSRSVIVRRPPLGHVLATAHDMAREHRVMAALHGTRVPVPLMYAVCGDPTVIGAPFYVMEKVRGTAYRRRGELEALGAERTRVLSTRMVDTLAALHEVDPAAVGLADFGRPDGFLARQVRRWAAQLAASRSRELPGADELLGRLERSIPQQSPPAIVHGDYRLDNLLVDEDERIAAVVDWEMATLGDPLTDVALLLAYHRVAALVSTATVADASNAPGFLGAEEVLDRYASRTGRDLSRMGFYLGLACFKLAVVLEGIHYRYVHGQTVGDGFDSVGTMVQPLLQLGLEMTREHA